MKNWFWIPLAAIVGGIAGSWGPREDLKLYKETVRAEQSNRKAAKTAGFDAFARLANIPDVAKTVRRPPTNAVTNAASKASSAETPTNQVAQTAQAKKHPHANWSREDLRLRLEEAAELWNTRVELSKTRWKAKLGVAGGKASEDFEATVGAMNESIRETMQAMAEEIEKAGKLTPELSLRLMGDVSRTLAETYDALGTTVAPERRGEVSEVPVFEFINPMVAEPLVSVQDKLDPGFTR